MDETMLEVTGVITDWVLLKCMDFVHTYYEIRENKDVVIVDIKHGIKLYH